ncbi:hypothetical protein KQI30_13575 [Clostridium bornimense]|uniref:DUF1659 domain-containing protein n=1 Tax=Clostridium bornimense TaxID=1216932 RepID=UPI001C126C46|nr:hypothetical protein [Clostridium bornimense]MBU5317281.1 hypothetical protein [Clostridium bornimense]
MATAIVLNSTINLKYAIEKDGATKIKSMTLSGLGENADINSIKKTVDAISMLQVGEQVEVNRVKNSFLY